MSAIFYFPPSPTTLQTILTHLQTHYSSPDVTFSSSTSGDDSNSSSTSTRWSLSHHLMRSTTQNVIPGQQPGTRYHHVLTSTLWPGKTWCCITPPHGPTSTSDTPSQPPLPGAQADENDKDTVISIPFAQTEGYLQTLTSKLNALWLPRFAVRIPDGAILEIEIGEPASTGTSKEKRPRRYRVLAGDVEQKGQLRGTVCGVFAVHDEDEERREEEEKASFEEDVRRIREAVKSAGVEAAKEVIGKPEAGRQASEKAMAEVRLWCEALRARGV